jgi:hypothetical protein
VVHVPEGVELGAAHIDRGFGDCCAFAGRRHGGKDARRKGPSKCGPCRDEVLLGTVAGPCLPLAEFPVRAVAFARFTPRTSV